MKQYSSHSRDVSFSSLDSSDASLWSLSESGTDRPLALPRPRPLNNFSGTTARPRVGRLISSSDDYSSSEYCSDSSSFSDSDSTTRFLGLACGALGAGFFGATRWLALCWRADYTDLFPTVSSGSESLPLSFSLSFFILASFFTDFSSSSESLL